MCQQVLLAARLASYLLPFLNLHLGRVSCAAKHSCFIMALLRSMLALEVVARCAAEGDEAISL